jgi:protein phosphatase
VTLRLRAAARTDVGLRRPHNEDALFVGRRLVAVADGMGGQVFGEVASRITILTLARLDDDGNDDLLTDLRDAIGDANEQLRSLIAGDDELDGMGTTLTALLSVGGKLALAHVGDSRAYLLRDGELRQISHDHSLVQSMVDSGQISAEEASQHPSRAVITRALDGHGDVDPDLGMLEARQGDRYLLCSDGLSDVVTLDTIAEALGLGERDAACDRLVELALRAGGPDNITVIVADVVDDTGELAPQPVIIGGSAEDGTGSETAPHDVGDSAARRAAELEPHSASQGGRSIMRRGPGRRVAVVIAAALIVAGLATLGTWLYLRGQYYVGAGAASGTVAVYRGVQGSVLGIDLSSLQTTTDVPLSQLPQDDMDRVNNGISASSLSSAAGIVTTLRQDACAQLKAQQGAAHAGTRKHRAHRRPAPAPLPSWCTS